MGELHHPIDLDAASIIGIGGSYMSGTISTYSAGGPCKTQCEAIRSAQLILEKHQILFELKPGEDWTGM